MATKANPHFGSSFASFLAEDGRLADVTTTAMKRVLAWQIEQAMKNRASQDGYGKRMGTSRAALDRPLDADNTSVTLQTMGRAAAVLGMALEIGLSAEPPAGKLA